MNAQTGKQITGVEHLKQSIQDILTTPIGTRVMRRNYGSRLFEIIDSPLLDNTFIEVKAAVADALGKWESRIALKKINVVKVEQGYLELELYGKYIDENTEFAMDGIIIS